MGIFNTIASNLRGGVQGAAQSIKGVFEKEPTEPMGPFSSIATKSSTPSGLPTSNQPGPAPLTLNMSVPIQPAEKRVAPRVTPLPEETKVARIEGTLGAFGGEKAIKAVAPVAKEIGFLGAPFLARTGISFAQEIKQSLTGKKVEPFKAKSNLVQAFLTEDVDSEGIKPITQRFEDIRSTVEETTGSKGLGFAAGVTGLPALTAVELFPGGRNLKGPAKSFFKSLKKAEDLPVNFLIDEGEGVIKESVKQFENPVVFDGNARSFVEGLSEAGDKRATTLLNKKGTTIKDLESYVDRTAVDAGVDAVVFQDELGQVVRNVNESRNLVKQSELFDTLKVRDAEDVASRSSELLEGAAPPIKRAVAETIELPGNQQRKFLDTVVKSDKVSPFTKNQVARINPQTYQAVSNEQMFTDATERIAADRDGVIGDLFGATTLTKERSANALKLIEEADAAGDFDFATEVVNQLDSLARESGRSIQLLSSLSRRSSEGFARQIDKEFEQALKKTSRLDRMLGRVPKPLDESERELMKKAFDDAQKIEDPLEKVNAMKQLLSAINSRIPARSSELFDAFRYTNMLGNPQSQLRNFVGTGYQTWVQRPLELFGEAMFDVIGKDVPGVTKTRFRDVPIYYKHAFNSIVNSGKFAVNWIFNPESRKIIDAGVENMFTEASATPSLKNGLLEFLRAFKGVNAKELTNADLRTLRVNQLPKPLTVVLRAMEATDRMFQSQIISGEYARLIDNGVDPVKAREMAEEVAEELAFRQVLKGKAKKDQGKLLSMIDDVTAGLNKVRKQEGALGTAAKWMLPFVNTPMNVFKFWLQTNPITGMAALVGASPKQKKKILSRMLIGTGAMVYGKSLAAEDRIAIRPPVDPDEASAWYASGRKPNSIAVDIGGKTYWVPAIYFGPAALSLILPGVFKEITEDGPEATTDSDIQKVGKVAGEILRLLSDQTYAQQVGYMVDIVNGNVDKNLMKNLAFTGEQVLPLSGLVRWMKNIDDPLYRKTKTFMDVWKKDYLFEGRKDLEAYTTPTGEFSERKLRDSLLPWGVGEYIEDYDVLLEQTARMRQLKEEEKFEDDVRSQQINAIADKILDLPEDKKKEAVRTLINTGGPDAEAVAKVIVQRLNAGTAYKEVQDIYVDLYKKISKKSAPVAAAFIKSYLDDMTDPEEKQNFMRLLKENKVLTEEVARELINITTRESQATALDEFAPL